MSKRTYYYIRINQAKNKSGRGYRVVSATSETMEQSEVLGSNDAVTTHILAMIKCWHNPLIVFNLHNNIKAEDQNEWDKIFLAVNKLCLDVPSFRACVLPGGGMPQSSAKAHNGYIAIEPIEFKDKKKKLQFKVQCYGSNHEPLEHGEGLQSAANVVKHITGMWKCWSNGVVVDRNILSPDQSRKIKAQGLSVVISRTTIKKA